MGEDHNWMYNGSNKNGDHLDEWMTKTESLQLFSTVLLLEQRWCGALAISNG
jgi:hypothetical protein